MKIGHLLILNSLSSSSVSVFRVRNLTTGKMTRIIAPAIPAQIRAEMTKVRPVPLNGAGRRVGELPQYLVVLGFLTVE